MKAFAAAAFAVSRRHDEIIAITNGSTPSVELVSLLQTYDSADTTVGDACVKLQEGTNAKQIDVDIGCREATTEFKCYSTNGSGSRSVATFEEARRVVMEYAGPSAPIPTNLPSWVKDFQVATDTKPTEEGDPESAGIVFANYDDRSRPQVTVSFIPRPYCGRQHPGFETHATVGSTDLVIRSFSSGEETKGLTTTLKLPGQVVAIRAIWWADDAPSSYDVMVPTIVEWAELVIQTDAGR